MSLIAPSPLAHSVPVDQDDIHDVEIGDARQGESPLPDNAVRRAFTSSSIDSYTFRIPEDRMLGSLDTAHVIANRMIGTGIFSTPSTIMKGTNSVGLVIVSWLLGGVLTLAGLYAYAELGIAIPRNGAEKLYLERIYRKPLYFMTAIVAIHTIFLSISAANTVAFTEFLLMTIQGRSGPDLDNCPALNSDTSSSGNDWKNKGISIATITIVCLVHALRPKWGIYASRFFSFFKLITVVFVVICMFPALAGRVHLRQGQSKPQNFRSFQGDPNGQTLPPVTGGYTIALMEILWAYNGWGDANRVLSEVRDPPTRFKRAIPLAVGTITGLYLLANIAYFAAMSTTEIANAGQGVAVYFFIHIFGCIPFAVNFIPLCISFSALGNVLAGAFAASRVKQELAKEGILPWSKFFATDYPANAPTGGLFLHWFFSAILIMGPSSTDAYEFLTTLNVYSFSIIQLFVGIGLLYLTCYPFSGPPDPKSRLYSWYEDVENWKLDVERRGGFRTWRLSTFFWVLSLIYIVFVGFVPYNNKSLGIFSSIQWFYVPVVGIVVLVCGIAYWLLWTYVWPWLGYAIEAERQVLPDGSERLVYRRVRAGGHRSVPAWLEQQDEERNAFREQQLRQQMNPLHLTSGGFQHENLQLRDMPPARLRVPY